MDWYVALIVGCTLTNIALTAATARLRTAPSKHVLAPIDADTCEAIRSFGLTPRREDLDVLAGSLGRRSRSA